MTSDPLARLSAGLAEDERAARHALMLQQVGVTADTPLIEHRYEWAWHTRMPSTGGAGTQYVPGAPAPDDMLRRVEAIWKVLRRHEDAERDSLLSDRDAGFEAGLYAALEILADTYPEDTTETEKP